MCTAQRFDDEFEIRLTREERDKEFAILGMAFLRWPIKTDELQLPINNGEIRLAFTLFRCRSCFGAGCSSCSDVGAHVSMGCPWKVKELRKNRNEWMFIQRLEPIVTLFASLGGIRWSVRESQEVTGSISAVLSGIT